MRYPAIALLAACVLLPATAGAQTALNKCIDARGAVTYSNLPCRNAREVKRVEIDPAPILPAASPKPVPAETPSKPAPAVTPKPAAAATPPTPVKAATPPKSAAAPTPPKSVDTAPAPTLRVEPPRSPAKPTLLVPSGQCETLSDQLGRLLDKMDEARRKGYSQEQMNSWNEEARELERKKQQSGCF